MVTPVPTMTREQFNYIASVINSMPVHAPTLRSQVTSVALTFANALEDTNKLFDREKFLTASTEKLRSYRANVG